MARKVATRLERCDILYRDKPPRFFAIIDEAVIKRPIGGPKVMRGQVEHLIALNETSRAVIQVIPSTVGFHRGLVGSFILASLDGPEGDVLYTEGHVRGIITESHQDIAEVRDNWDMLQANALPVMLSTELMREVAETWT